MLSGALTSALLSDVMGGKIPPVGYWIQCEELIRSSDFARDKPSSLGLVTMEIRQHTREQVPMGCKLPQHQPDGSRKVFLDTSSESVFFVGPCLPPRPPPPLNQAAPAALSCSS